MGLNVKTWNHLRTVYCTFPYKNKSTLSISNHIIFFPFSEHEDPKNVKTVIEPLRMITKKGFQPTYIFA